MATKRKPPPAKKRAPQATKPRKPVWKEVEERERRKVANRVRARRKVTRRRLAVVYDVNGPRVTLGLGWFLLTLIALVAGPFGVAALYGVVAAMAGFQTAACWRRAGARPHRLIAGIGAGVIALAAAGATWLVGGAVLAVVALALFTAFTAAAANSRANPIDDAGFTIRCAFFVGLAAASVVITARFSMTACVGLVLIVSAYEIGDYLVGSGASNPYEGPVAGATAIVVVTFAITAIGIEPFVFPDAFALGAMAAVLCPIGQLAASAILPSVDAPASALRRLDSLLVLAPAWALVVGRMVG
jgi:hypothetical protein